MNQSGDECTEFESRSGVAERESECALLEFLGHAKRIKYRISLLFTALPTSTAGCYYNSVIGEVLKQFVATRSVESAVYISYKSEHVS
jgi:hypothetical protein